MREREKDSNDTAATAIAEGRDAHEALRARIAKRHQVLADDIPRDATEQMGPSPILVCMADVKAEAVKWLWPFRIALGKLTLIAGDPGLGKSFVTLDVAARVSVGGGWPDGPQARATPGGVVLLSAEDDPADTIRPRLDAAKADPKHVMLLTAIRESDPDGNKRKRSFNLARDLEALESAIANTEDCRLVIVDPISAYMGKTDSHNNAEVRAVLTPLAELAAQRDVAVVAITHFRKGGGEAIYRAMGSLAFVAAARAAYLVLRDPQNGARRLFMPAKNNIGNDQEGFAYQIAAEPGQMPRVVWETEPVKATADEILSTLTKTPGPAPEERNEAGEWLQAELSAGARPALELFSQAEKVGISRSTLKRAKRTLGVLARKTRFDGQWTWELPSERHEVCQPVPVTSNLAPLGELGPLGENPNKTRASARKKASKKAKGAKFSKRVGRRHKTAQAKVKKGKNGRRAQLPKHKGRRETTGSSRRRKRKPGRAR